VKEAKAFINGAPRGIRPRAMTYQAQSIGSFAADILSDGGDATIIAVFDRSFYLLCPKGIIAICDLALGRGPINALVATPRPWRSLVRVDGKATVAASTIAIENGPRIDLTGAALWSPPPFPDWNDASARAGTAAVAALLDHALTGAGANDLAMGLAPFVLAKGATVPTNPMLAGAEQLLKPLIRALPSALARRLWPREALDAATLLVGLGPGGLMIALSARGELRLRDQLWEQIVDDLGSLTVPPSAMHLTAAAHGMAHEALHALVAAMLTGKAPDIATKLNAVLSIGATSGIDAIAGVIIGLSQTACD
jgi:hypothetical protein